MRRALLAGLAAALLAPSVAAAAQPIMALRDVQAGARCTGLSVVRGTTISSFDAEVLDVVTSARPDAARILVRASGPAVDATGLGQGFSGSPILCPGADGVARTIGAVSGSVGEFGGRTALVMPIEAMLAQPAVPPAAGPARAGSLAGPLTLGGVSPRVGAALQGAARRAGRVLLTTPGARTRAVVPPQPLVPGASVAASMTSGDISLGVIGTVTYTDGADVWAFGHPFDGAGRRSLFLQDAVIHTVVNNPVQAPELLTYKLGSPANDRGTITGDGLSAVTGRLGALPAAYPVRVTARDRDTGRIRSVVTRVADEGDVGLPAGASALGLVAGASVAEAASGVLGGGPARQSGELCMAVTLRELARPLRFCNAYAVDGPVPNGLAGLAAADAGAGAAVLDSYRFGTLHPTNVEVGLRVRRGVRQAFLEDATAPSRARRGRTIRVRLHLRRTGTGARSTRTIRLRVPRDAPVGERTLRLRGTPAEQGSDPSGEEGGDLVVLFDEEDNGDDPGPASLAEVRRAFAGLARYDGVRASFGGGRPLRRAYRDPDLRITGDVRIPITIRR